MSNDSDSAINQMILFNKDTKIKDSYPRLCKLDDDSTLNLEEKATQYLKMLALFLLSPNKSQKFTNFPLKGPQRKRRLARKLRRRQSLKKMSKYKKLSSTLNDIEKELDQKYSNVFEFSDEEIGREMV